MKVVKTEDVLDAPNQVLVAQLQEKFEEMRKNLETKKYSVYLTPEQTKFLFEEFYTSVEWKGYESYAISETYQQFAKSSTEELNDKFAAEIIEAVFHFLKNFIAKGFQKAILFKQVCDQFALPMKEINQDRQDLRDISLEVVAAEQGISIEQLQSDIEKGKYNN
jgi:hypothetical protein